MKKGIILTLFLCISLITLKIEGQEKIYLSSNQFVDDGIEFHNKGEYNRALTSYQKVSKCDPNYERTCYEMALTYYYLNKYEEALAKCQEAISLNYKESFVYSLMGSILDEMGRPNEGIEILTNALKVWPYNQNILYNLAVCYINTEQPIQAEEILIKSIKINPYHVRTHLGIAKANYMMGRITQSYLAYNMVLLLNPTGNNLVAFEEAISQKPKLTIQGYKYPYPKDVNSKKWDDVKELLQSEIAFSEDFDYDYNYNYTIARQSLMLFRKLTFDPTDTSIYNNLYARLFAELYQKIGFETYLNYILKNTNNDEVTKWNNKNQDKLNSFIKWAQSFIDQGRLYGFSYQDEQNLIQLYHFDNDGNLTSIGELNSRNGNIKNGVWINIASDGYINEKGFYNNNKAEGEWLSFWPDGSIYKRLYYKDDKLEGLNRVYYPNGALKGEYNFKADNKDGISETFSHSGFLTNRTNYSEGLASGPGFYNNYSQGYIRTYNYDNDSLEKENTETWLNGNQKKYSSYHKDMLDGKYATWYSNSSKESECTYKNDTLVGKYYEYYPNNQISKACEYDTKGNLTGKILTYDRKGNLTSEESDYKDGKLTGTRTEFFPDGNKQRVLTYQNDHLIEIKCFDNKGNQLYIATEKNGSLYLKSFYDDGILSSEGLLKNDHREGKWKFYNPLGIITSEYYYSEGLLNGIQHTYYENGQINKILTYSGDYLYGKYKEYYINGHLKMQGNYDSTGLAGKWIYYFENDTVSNISFYNDGNNVGRSFSYYPNGQLKAEEFYNSDGKSIRYKEFEIDGSLICDLNYEYGSDTFEIILPNQKLKQKKTISDNVAHGLSKVYYPNGQVASQINYNHGLINDTVKHWDYKGCITYEMPYILNLAEGDGKWYNDNKLEYIAHYEQNNLQGTSTSFHYNGQKFRVATYVDDKRNGYTDYFTPEGIFMYRVRFVDNTMKAYSYMDKSGTMVPEIVITDTTSKIIAYFPNGNVSAIIPLYKGLYHGKLMTYYSSGSLLREATFKYDESVGYDKSFYPNNKIREIINYASDNRDGLYEMYFENGNKQKTGYYFMGQEQGDWLIYNNDGSLKETLTYQNGVIYDIK
jgi:uncharacterized protein